ncbi:MAG: hypothetical protein ACREX5_08725, partial [Achromobacter pestifer]
MREASVNTPCVARPTAGGAGGAGGGGIAAGGAAGGAGGARFGTAGTAGGGGGGAISWLGERVETAAGAFAETGVPGSANAAASS